MGEPEVSSVILYSSLSQSDHRVNAAIWPLALKDLPRPPEMLLLTTAQSLCTDPPA